METAVETARPAPVRDCFPPRRTAGDLAVVPAADFPAGFEGFAGEAAGDLADDRGVLAGEALVDLPEDGLADLRAVAGFAGGAADFARDFAVAPASVLVTVLPVDPAGDLPGDFPGEPPGDRVADLAGGLTDAGALSGVLSAVLPRAGRAVFCTAVRVAITDSSLSDEESGNCREMRRSRIKAVEMISN